MVATKSLTASHWSYLYRYGILDFGIKLDNDTYEAGETAKGTLLTKADKRLRVSELKFSVLGKDMKQA
jgi:hypothetical protein